MLTKYEEQALRLLRHCYCYMYKVPIIWDPILQHVSTNKEPRKWIYWWIGNFFVFILWLTCVYTLITQFFLNRKELELLHICILTTGFCCFTATLTSAHGLTSLRNTEYVSAINEYIKLEMNVFQSKLHYNILPFL